MSQRQRLIPGPDHPITIEPAKGKTVAKVGGTAIAESSSALVLREASYPPVIYIPREDVDMAGLVRSDHTTYCPYKGEAAYFSLPALGERGENAVWTYETPYEAVSEIAGHLAFYSDRVEVVAEQS